MNVYEIISFGLYLLVVLAIGIWFFFKGKTESEKDYFLGGRKMSGLVAALSAGASDMSAWCLMGLPGAIYLVGMGQVWISVGLIIGTILAWIFIAPRLRVYAIKANDSITIPQFLTNRFLSKSAVLRLVCAIVFLVAYCIYMASSLVACGNLFSTLTGGFIDKTWGMVIAGLIIIAYTMLGGFNAVCWTDFIQGMLMLAAIMLLPIIMLIMMGTGNLAEGFMPWLTAGEDTLHLESSNYFNLLSSGNVDWESISSILSGLGWGLGYFGMPHIIVRYMSIKSKKEMRKSQIVGSCWTFAILVMAAVFALVAHNFVGSMSVYLNNEGERVAEMVFVDVVRQIFKWGPLALIGGLLVSAIIAASMSTADSQLLLASSAFASDIFKGTIKKNATDKQMVWVSRIVVVVISIIAFVIAFFGDSIMKLVSDAWAIFGAAFSPAIILALYWKRFNYKGCVSGIIAGFVVSCIWVFVKIDGATIGTITNLYAIIPGFIAGLAASIIGTLVTKAPTNEVMQLFDEVRNSDELKYNIPEQDEAVKENA
ncbi:MAG: sodium/proline symporter [Clostridiales bacterium]|nr:sodium/proline symporter [Clostridiales bacterium]